MLRVTVDRPGGMSSSTCCAQLSRHATESLISTRSQRNNEPTSSCLVLSLLHTYIQLLNRHSSWNERPSYRECSCGLALQMS